MSMSQNNDFRDEHEEESERKSNRLAHPYLVVTITPSGGLIVNMHWMDRPPEPLAFTNESDFSAWLKSAVASCSARTPRFMRSEDQSDNNKSLRKGKGREGEPQDYVEHDIQTKKRSSYGFGNFLTGRA